MVTVRRIFDSKLQDHSIDFILDYMSGAPEDAFEVALLDANTGASLAGALSLSHKVDILKVDIDFFWFRNIGGNYKLPVRNYFLW